MTMSHTKKKRVSKKSKLSWRKHVNINDVEEFLEEQRLEERLGPPLTTLTNDELFKVDVAPSLEPFKSKKERLRLKLAQTPKCFALLEPHTNVPDPITKRNRVRSKAERKNDILKKIETENRAKGILKPRELQAIRDHEANEKKRALNPKRGDFNGDIWNEEANAENDWFSKSTVKHNLVGTGNSRKTVKTPTKLKTSVLPPVEVPHPGMSYNPSFNDHQDLLKTIAEKETKIIKEEKHLDRVTRQMFNKVSEQRRDNMWLQEMSEGLPKKVENNDDSDGEFKSINPPTKNKKKTLKQRGKQKEQKLLEKLRKLKKINNKKISDIHQLRALTKQIEKKEVENKSIREKRKDTQAEKSKGTKRLGALKFEEIELEFNMGVDISGNLRNLKTEGNLLNDRFKSMQKRNIIQPTIRRTRKKSKVKVYTKPGYKEDWVKSVARSDINKT